TRRGLKGQGIGVEFTEAAVDWLARRGYQPEYGARPLRRTIQREVDNELSRLLLDGTLREGGRVTVDAEDGRLAFRVAQTPAPELGTGRGAGPVPPGSGPRGP